MNAPPRDRGHAADATGRVYLVAVALNLGFVAVEVGAGLYADSLAPLADAGHNFGDVNGLVLSWVALVQSRRKPSDRFTYGLRGSTILAALGNAMLLLVAVGGIEWEAVRRLAEPAAFGGPTIIGVAAAGVLINGATALMLLKGRTHDLNVRGVHLPRTRRTDRLLKLFRRKRGARRKAAEYLRSVRVLHLHPLGVAVLRRRGIQRERDELRLVGDLQRLAVLPLVADGRHQPVVDVRPARRAGPVGGVDADAVGQLQEEVPEGREQLVRQPLALRLAEQVRAADRVGEQRVPAEDCERGVRAVVFGGEEGHVFRGVPGGMLRGEDDAAEVDRVAVAELLEVEAELRPALDREHGLRGPGPGAQLPRAGHEVGVGVGVGSSAWVIVR